jgi:hypothetical protein
MSTAAAAWTRESSPPPRNVLRRRGRYGRRRRPAHFADDATLTVQTDHVTFEGAPRLGACSRTSSALPRGSATSCATSVERLPAGQTEQGYIGELKDGTKNDMHNCNFFSFDADGKFTRVIIWMAGTNPLK